MKPATEQELAHAIRSTDEAFEVIGGGTRLVRDAGNPLYTSGMTGITLYEPGALTMVAQAGTPLAEIEAALDAQGQRLAFEPPDMRGVLGTTGEPTIGGVFATNASGSRRIAVGAARDFLLGVRFVDGSGNIVKNGGRVMKNVTGYDLVKLMAGSWGTLGVLSEVSFKVLPKPETTASLMIYGPAGARAVEIMSAALGSPYDVTGAAHVPEEMSGYPVTFLRIEGFEASVKYRLEQLKTLLSPLLDGSHKEHIVAPDPDIVATQWRSIRDVDDFEGATNLWKISTKPSASAGILNLFPDGTQAMLDWGGGLIWIAAEPEIDLRATLGSFEGHATLVRGNTYPRTHPESAGVAAISTAIRQKYDPRGILNPGRMG